MDNGLIYYAQWPSFKTSIHWLLYKIESHLCRDKATLLRSLYASGDDGGQRMKMEINGKMSLFHFIV